VTFTIHLAARRS